MVDYSLLLERSLMLEQEPVMNLKVSHCNSVKVLIDIIALYRKIVSYVLLRSGLGLPTDIAVVREATGKNCNYNYSTLYSRFL